MGLLGKIIAVGATATAGFVAAKVLKNKNTDTVETSKKEGINATRDNEYYREEDAMGIAKELSGAGFVNIELKPIKKLGIFSAKKYGKVDDVFINGENEFSKEDKFLPSSYVVISYFDFKDSVDPCVYDTVKRIDYEHWNNTNHKEEISPVKDLQREASASVNPVTPAQDDAHIAKKFCPFCGAKTPSDDARFCILCGKSIT